MSTATRRTSVAISHPLRMWVQALEAVIGRQDDLEVVAAHTDPSWARNALSQGAVDVVVLGLTPEDGAGPVQELHESCPGTGIAVIADSDDPQFIAAVVLAGARGYLAPDCSLGELLQAIRAIPRGGTWMRPHHVTKLIEGMLAAESTNRQDRDQLAPLSAREREVLQCLALGLTRLEIADRLQLSPNTVRTHIHHVLRKLEVHSTLAAVSILRKAPERRHHDDERITGDAS